MSHDVLLTVDDGRGGSDCDWMRTTVGDRTATTVVGVVPAIAAERAAAAGTAVALPSVTAGDNCGVDLPHDHSL